MFHIRNIKEGQNFKNKNLGIYEIHGIFYFSAPIIRMLTVVLYLVIILYVCSKKNEPTIRVAFVFAGSPRSFIFPAVKRTIQKNLILSFCPPDICKYDIFVRISTSDNTHSGYNATGTLKRLTTMEVEEIQYSLKTIVPFMTNSGHLHVSYYELGSKAEIDQMKEYRKNNFMHKIYRELDSRRYSMFYSRWKAYEMMLRQERIGNISYSWVVHARLDAAWSSPIDSVHSFLAGKFYGPDLWHSDVPDTFSIMSRNISDLFFSLDKLFKPGILCLGGPNFDTRLLSSEKLLTFGYNHSEIDIILAEDCRTKFPINSIFYTKKYNITWSSSGYSEFILKRKLQTHGYSILNGGIVLIPLFTYLVRVPLKPYCFYLDTGYFISWLKTTQSVNCAMFTTCIMLNDDLRIYEHSSYRTCSPIDESTARVVGNTNTMAMSTAITLPKIMRTSLDSCLLQKENTDLNFMPFRLRSRNTCISSSMASTTTARLNISSCVNYVLRNKIMHKYAEEQLFYFYPLLKTPQKIRQHTTISNRKLCLTAIPLLVSSVSGIFNQTYVPIKLDDCTITSDVKYPSNQMFKVEIVNISRPLSGYSYSSDSISSSNNNNNNNGYIPLQQSNLPPVSGIVIKWQQPPNGQTYCVYFPRQVKDLSTTATVKVDMISPVLRKCHPSFIPTPTSRGFTIILERTKTWGEPYRPGITIGKYPTW